MATADGLLAIERDGDIFALGPGWINGPVNDMAVNAAGDTVYGVAGDEDDINVVFSYDDRKGLRWLGSVSLGGCEYGDQSSPHLTSIAVSGDDSVIAVGAGGRMGCVYLYRK